MSTFDLTIGAAEIGLFVAIFLYGIATAQFFLYTQGNYHDPLWLRILVVAVWILETAQTIFSCGFIYRITVVDYGRPDAIGATNWVSSAATAISPAIGGLVQGFYANRVRSLSGSLIIPVISWGLSAFYFALGLAIAITTMMASSDATFFSKWPWLSPLAFSLSAVVDVLNTSSICYCLLRQRNGFRTTKKLVDKLVLWAIETGLITSICAVVTVICVLAMPDNLVFFGIFMVHAKLFSNSLLASLNARQGLRRESRAATGMTTSRWGTAIFSPPSHPEERESIVLGLAPVAPVDRDGKTTSAPPRTTQSSNETDKTYDVA